MSWDLTARRLAPPSPLSLLLVLVLLSGAGALRPEELFPYGESWRDRLPREGDDESSAAVKLAVPLRFYCVQFSNLYMPEALEELNGSVSLYLPEENTIQNPCDKHSLAIEQVSCCLSSEKQQRSIIIVSPL